MPVLRAVPASRIASVLTKARRLGSSLHYYWPDLGESKNYWPDPGDSKNAPIKSSSEVLVIDDIKSVPEYAQRLGQALAAAETEEAPFVSPPAKRPARGK
jgi:hypothetical protein